MNLMQLITKVVLILTMDRQHHQTCYKIKKSTLIQELKAKNSQL